MSIFREFKMYIDEIELIQAQNRVECALYSIIACMIRESKHGGEISLRDVTARRKSEFAQPFLGDSGFPDFVIRERVKSNDAAVLGAVEVKYINRDLDRYLEQLKGRLIFYKKVIYTNGLKWRYYEGSIVRHVWEVELGEFEDGKIDWYNNDNWEELLLKLDGIHWTK